MDRNATLRVHHDHSLGRCRHPMSALGMEAAMQSAVELLGFFGKDVGVEAKGIANFVSSADLAAERAIVDTLRKSFPAHAIISEESHSDRADAEHLWIVDPLDGTSNFLHGIPHFAVSIAYYYRGVGQVGIVCDPAAGDWYVAERGEGMWRNGDRMAVSRATRLDESMVACGFYYDRGPMMQATLATLSDLFQAQIHGMRRMGAAALDLAYVACGQFEAFFEYRLSPWDYAAGRLLVQEAGGQVSDCFGGELPLTHASGICATNTLLHSAMLQKLMPHRTFPE